MSRKPFVLLAAAAVALGLLPVVGHYTARAAQEQVTPPPPGPAAAALTPVGTVRHRPLGEMSGIVKSRRYPDVYWVHNDSGDVPRLFAIRANGDVVVPAWLRGNFSADGAAESAERPAYPGLSVEMASNFDWEDIAIEGDTLYIADVGNNGNARRDLGVYVLAEPNPEATEKARVQQWLPVVYEDQKGFPEARWHFDCEAVFAKAGKLYFVTKHRASGQINAPETGANLYRMDTRHADRPNVLKKIDGVADLGGWVTAADLSPDGKTLAVLCHYPVQSVWLFEAKDGGDRFLTGRARRRVFTGGKQCEAICWEDGNTLLVGNEQRDLFRLRVSEFRDAPSPAPAR